ncbi:branched-chain amino acid ABC transporter permease [Streptomyces griseiscabiei]|uniref:Branched-chain amino acid ABC transporter permease n=1 Tax=Streptomyces griseiscabiei TaxID=2993540 RepID=A0ABU4LBV4_9ACTN|nr:branched-chain amino acid ABC transporter permease [Streptomyces griseiscabiei]MBZ3900243.1 branched-chain amino acid ABC transporter permease [Streptomyces griseiscabiei]MDX2913251.1 branched-chain amino acid ABC transporter permease [Streptomyces griseiscabiei]
MNWINALVQGVMLGGVYALFACGLSLMFGVMRTVNLSHGDLAVLGAFLVATLAAALGISPFFAVLLVLPLMGLVGVALQRGLLSTALRTGEMSSMLATFGLAIVLQNALLEIFSADSRSLDVGSLATAGLQLGPSVSVPYLGLLTVVVAVALLGGLQLLLARTGVGRAIRATAADADTAELVGIDSRRVYAWAAAIAVATAGLAGAFFAMRSSVSPSMGPTQLLFAFEVVVIGGLGSLWGTLVGGMVLGVAQTVGAQVDPRFSIVAGHVVFLAVLAFRPQGLLGMRRSRT